MILDGRIVQEKVINDTKALIKNKNIKNAIILVGSNPASKTYVNNKIAVCGKAGIETELLEFPIDTSEDTILNKIDELNIDTSITGIIVQLPLPSHMSADKISESINPNKDLDCFSHINIGKMFAGNMTIGKDILPATPAGILLMLEHYNIDVLGKDVAIIGRSNIVGKPMATMLTNMGATVTICNSKTKNLKAFTKKADITILATGATGMFNTSYFKTHSVVIDVGINIVNGKSFGDFNKVSEPYQTKKEYNIFNIHIEVIRSLKLKITPVPNGVGRTTVAALLYNSIACYNKNNNIK